MAGDLFVVEAADQEAWLETEGPAADQDEETQADQHDGEQDVFPALQDLGDRSAGGDELGQAHQHRDQGQEHDAVGSHSPRADAEEGRGVDADVVPAVGEGHPGHGPDGDILALDLGVVIIVFASAPPLPGRPHSQAQRDEPEVGDDPRGQERARA